MSVPRRDAGADGLVVAMKPGNAGGSEGADSPAWGSGQPEGEEPMPEAKPYAIPKHSCGRYQRVKANRGAAGFGWRVAGGDSRPT